MVYNLLKVRSEEEFRFPFHNRAILDQEVVLWALLESHKWGRSMTGEHHLPTLLLDQAGGVDMDTMSEGNGMVLMSAVQAGFTGIVQRLLQRDSGEGEFVDVLHAALMTAVENGDKYMVKLLLDYGAQIRTQKVPESNALFAVLHSFGPSGLDIFEQLLTADSKAMNGVDSKGDSVLGVAIRARWLEDIANHLIDKGVNTNRELPGKGPLALSVARQGSWSTFAALLNCSANSPLVQDEFSRSPLTVVINAGNLAVAENLLDQNGVEVNDRDRAERTPLISSILTLKAFVPVLFEKAAGRIDIDIHDAEGKTTLAHACFIDEKASVTRLLNAGADPALIDIRRRGPLYWACRKASSDVFQGVLQTIYKKYPGTYTTRREAALGSSPLGLV